MESQQIKAFIDAMAASDLHELEVSHEGWTLRLVRHAGGARAETQPVPARTPRAVAQAAATPPAAAPSRPGPAGPEEVRAPMFGVVHLQQAPGEPPWVKVGDTIEAGQMLCSIEAMKVFNEVRAEHGGRVTAILVASGAEVEAGQALLAIERVAHV
jgi:acetyl-CoA carboxylase biotin carboxyl carrier protein